GRLRMTTLSLLSDHIREIHRLRVMFCPSTATPTSDNSAEVDTGLTQRNSGPRPPERGRTRRRRSRSSSSAIGVLARGDPPPAPDRQGLTARWPRKPWTAAAA